MKCTMCGNATHKGSGKMFVRNDGRIFYFCSSKCQKNWKLGRSPKKTGWAKTRTGEEKR
jgi:large subunit ribosomal protein L24e